MVATFRIDKNKIEILPGKKILKDKDYKSFIEASEIIAAAQIEKQDIISQAKQEFINEKKRGYEEGKQAAKEETVATLLSVTSKVAEYTSAVETSLIGIVSSVLRKILGGYEEYQLIAKLVRTALEEVTKNSRVKVRVKPALLYQLEKLVDEILHDHPVVRYIEWVADYSIADGECILESDSTFILMSIEQQLEIISTLMKDIVSNEIKT